MNTNKLIHFHSAPQDRNALPYRVRHVKTQPIMSKYRNPTCFSLLGMIVLFACSSSPVLPTTSPSSHTLPKRSQIHRMKNPNLEFAKWDRSSALQMEQREAPDAFEEWIKPVIPYATLSFIFLIFGVYLGAVWRPTRASKARGPHTQTGSLDS